MQIRSDLIKLSTWRHKIYSKMGSSHAVSTSIMHSKRPKCIYTCNLGSIAAMAVNTETFAGNNEL